MRLTKMNLIMHVVGNKKMGVTDVTNGESDGQNQAWQPE